MATTAPQSTRVPLLTLTLGLTACGMPLASMQAPAPLPAGAGTSAVGFAPVFLGEVGGLPPLGASLLFGPYAAYRTGVAEGVDLGIGFGGFHGLSADAKLAVLDGPIDLAVGLALSMRSAAVLFGGDIPVGSTGVHPGVFVGTDRVHGGARLLLFPTTPSGPRWTTLFLGTSLGVQRRVVPEIGRLIDPAGAESRWYAGISLQRDAARDAARRRPPWRLPRRRRGPRAAVQSARR